MTGDELFLDLCRQYKELKPGSAKTALGLQLMPYFHPKLKHVEVQAQHDVEVTISIGGTDA